MKRNTKQNKYMKWLVIGLVISMSLVCLSGCKSDSGDTKDNGTTGVTQEQNNTQNGTDGTTDPQDATNTDGGATDNPGSDGTSTSDGGTNGTSTDGDNTTPPATTAKTCTIQINCSLLVGKSLTGTGLEGMETLIPSNGIILPTTKITLTPGDTVYDVTLRVTKAQKIHMATEGTQAMGNLYIAAISNIYEKAYNSRSGWVYLINGIKPGIGSGAQELMAGDKLVWAYSLDNGNDL